MWIAGRRLHRRDPCRALKSEGQEAPEQGGQQGPGREEKGGQGGHQGARCGVGGAVSGGPEGLVSYAGLGAAFG